MVQCYLCKGKLRVTRDKHLYDEKLKKRYHLKCFAGICRVCDKPVYSKSKHKVIGSNVWHDECYKRAHRHNPKYRTLKIPPPPPKLRTLKLPPPPLPFRKLKHKNPRRPTKEFWDKHYPEVLAQYEKKYPKKEAEERARKATAAIWYDTMGPKKKAGYEAVRRKREAKENPRRRTLEEEEAAIEFKRDFEDTDQEEARYDKDDPDSDYSIDQEGRRETQEQGEAEFWQDAQQAFSEGAKAFENWLKENVDTTMIDKVREKATRYFSKKNPTEEEFEKRLIETLDHDFLIFSMTNLPATKSVTVMSLRPTPVSKSTYSVDDTPEHRRLLDELGIEYTVLKISPEHAKLLVKQMLKKYRKNPTLVTPEAEMNIVGAFQRVIHGIGTEADKLMVRMAREADVVMSTGPSVMIKRNPEEPLFNPKGPVDYIIQDEFGTVFETGKGTTEQAESRALHYNKKYMREFKVIYPKGESPEVKKAAQTATREMLKD